MMKSLVKAFTTSSANTQQAAAQYWSADEDEPVEDKKPAVQSSNNKADIAKLASALKAKRLEESQKTKAQVAAEIQQSKTKAANEIRDSNGEVLAEFEDMDDQPAAAANKPPVAVAASAVKKSPAKPEIVVTRPPEPNKIASHLNGTSTLFSFNGAPVADTIVNKASEEAKKLIVESSTGQANLSSTSATSMETASTAAAATPATEEKKKKPARRARVKTKDVSKQAAVQDMDTASDSKTETEPVEKKKTAPKQKKKPERKASKSAEPAAQSMETVSTQQPEAVPESKQEDQQQGGIWHTIKSTFAGRGKTAVLSPVAPVPGKAGVKLPKKKKKRNNNATAAMRHRADKEPMLDRPCLGLETNALRRLARRGGIVRMGDKVPDAITKLHMKEWLTEVIRRSVVITEYRKSKTMRPDDVFEALHTMGFKMYTDLMKKNGKGYVDRLEPPAKRDTGKKEEPAVAVVVSEPAKMEQTA